jgi:hypothetical protein
MNKQDYDDLMAQVAAADLFADPIEVHLNNLANPPTLPAVAIAACVARFEEAVPYLHLVLSKAASDFKLTDAETDLNYYGLHIMAAARYTQAFPDLIRMLCNSSAEIEVLLGDAVTATLPNIIIGLFDGSTRRLFRLIESYPVIDEWVRGSALRAATYLTWEGRIDLNEMTDFLLRFYQEDLAYDGELVWHDWQNAIAMLGLRDMAPMVLAAREAGHMATDVDDPEHFATMLSEAEAAPRDIDRFTREQLAPIVDVAKTLSWGAYAALPDSGARIDVIKLLTQSSPKKKNSILSITNPNRHIGRNDPCPCGSGKKYKKCCL